MKKTKFDDKEYIQKAVLWVMKGMYCAPGSFLKRLIECCTRADEDNLERLRLGFPVVVGAVRAYQTGEKLDEYPLIKEATK